MVQFNSFNINLLIVPQIANCDNRVAVAEFVNWNVVAVKLRAVSRLHVSSMVLVEVVQLIVYIYWSFNVGFNFFQINFAQSWF